MSVLSRPAHRHVTAPTQREVRIPLPRTNPEPAGPALRPGPQITQPAPMPDRRARKIVLVGGALAVALAAGVGTYLLVDDGGGSSTVIAPSARVPSAADLGRDRAMQNRAPDAGLPAVPQAVTDPVSAAQAQRLRNSGDGATGFFGSSTARTDAEIAAAQAQRLNNAGDEVVFSGSTAGSDATRLTEAQRDAALARRAQNFPS